MICPYRENLIVSEQKEIRNEDDPEIIEKVEIKQYLQSAQCLKSDCAVWSEGRCHYNG